MKKTNIIEYQELPSVEIQDADIVINRVCWGGSVSGIEGTQNAPDAILIDTEQMEYYDEDLEYSPMKYMQVHVADRIDEFDKIKTSFSGRSSDKNQLLISLGGDHSITPQLTLALLKKPATILFLDAHADLRRSYMGDVNSHATPAFQLLKQGHKLLMVGIRSMYETEALRIKEDKNIICYMDRALRSEDIKQELLQRISDLEGDVYLSIDMDVFNPAYVPSVGTPQAGGIDYYFATDILEALFLKSTAKIRGVDMVELIPEESHVSQLFAAKLLQKIISYWGKSQGVEKGEKKGGQMDVEYE
ncbi:arginase family protein [Sulfurimonas sp. SAG-AH-194-C21]|nr:arginase family protein [Sulfurimonas sp. SAG-AH-194-C21]MDF1883453.1 arginase family protein [Sulfurimonas sp. SAG-AH-194-C21]